MRPEEAKHAAGSQEGQGRDNSQESSPDHDGSEGEETFEQLEKSLLDIFRTIDEYWSQCDTSCSISNSSSLDLGRTISSDDDSAGYEEFLKELELEDNVTIHGEKSTAAGGCGLEHSLNETTFKKPNNVGECPIVHVSDVQSDFEMTENVDIDNFMASFLEDEHLESNKKDYEEKAENEHNEDHFVEMASPDSLGAKNSLVNSESDCKFHMNSDMGCEDLVIFQEGSEKENANDDADIKAPMDVDKLYQENKVMKNCERHEKQEICNKALCQSPHSDDDDRADISSKEKTDEEYLLLNDDDKCFEEDAINLETDGIFEHNAYSQRENLDEGCSQMEKEVCSQTESRSKLVIPITDLSDDGSCSSNVPVLSESVQPSFTQLEASSSTIMQTQSCMNDNKLSAVETKLTVFNFKRDTENSKSSADGNIETRIKYDDSSSSMAVKKAESKLVSKMIGCSESSSELQNLTNNIEQNCKNEGKVFFISEDCVENNDINDPEWISVKQLTTEEERYKAVKECWESPVVPNPHRDLTHHSYRLRRLREMEVTTHISGKRPATNNPKDIMPCGKHHKRTASCTKILDEEIKSTRERYNSDQMKEHCIYEQKLQNIEFQLRNSNIYLTKRHREEMKRVNYWCVSSAEQHYRVSELNEWLQFERVRISNAACIARQEEKMAYEDLRNQAKSIFQKAINKLQNAKEEVLKFNQFYCGLHNIDPTIIEGRMLLEAEKMMEMHQAYQQYYRIP